MFPMMLFIFFCFLGLLAVLYHLLRRQERFCQALRDEHAQTRALLRALAARLDATEQNSAAMSAASPVPPAADPLLRLSFDAPEQKPAPPATDPALDLHFDPVAGTPR